MPWSIADVSLNVRCTRTQSFRCRGVVLHFWQLFSCSAKNPISTIRRPSFHRKFLNSVWAAFSQTFTIFSSTFLFLTCMIFSYIVLYLKCLYVDIWSNKSIYPSNKIKHLKWFAKYRVDTICCPSVRPSQIVSTLYFANHFRCFILLDG
jgi:hypothetical protein